VRQPWPVPRCGESVRWDEFVYLYKFKKTLTKGLTRPTHTSHTRTPTDVLKHTHPLHRMSGLNSAGAAISSWLPCLPLTARQPRVVFGPLLPSWHSSMRVRLHRPVYCVVDAGALAEQPP
jgi:hypothetical protein